MFCSIVPTPPGLQPESLSTILEFESVSIAASSAASAGRGVPPVQEVPVIDVDVHFVVVGQRVVEQNL